jgi:NAD(P)-dependent dehydrogenase (short-subunit alcohol dehydrogenase family)
MMNIMFDEQVAIVTGSGNGLGRSHAVELAKRGAKVVINELVKDDPSALETVDIIEKLGGEAIALHANVANYDEVEQMVQSTMDKWGRVDILINNAGVLRDKSFSKMTLDDFKLVIDVHLMGSVNCTKAVWEIMKQQNYGRIVMTTSSSGMYGNFGQSNYGAAKMAVIGLMNTLVIEGKKSDIKVNALSPSAGTQMTEGLIPPVAFDLMTTESVSAALLTLCNKESPNRTILCAGAGGYASTHVFETEGIYLPIQEQNPETIVAKWTGIQDMSSQKELTSGAQQTEKFLYKAMAASGGKL